MATKKQPLYTQKEKMQMLVDAGQSVLAAPPTKPKAKKKKKKTKGHPWKGAAPSLAEIEQQEIKKAASEKVPPNPHMKNGIQQNVQVAGATSFTVHLQARHAEWLQRVARSEARSPESMIERIIRAGYATDPSKGGIIEAAPGTSFPAEDIGKI
jgi:hypothetical protein